MNLLLSRLSIRVRIYIGFIVISCFVVLISIISVMGSTKTTSNFHKYESINEKTSSILNIENKVASLQRMVQEYINTGYETVAEKVDLNLEELRTLLDSASALFADDIAANDYLDRINTHFKKYSQTFSYAVEEIRNRELLLNKIEDALANVIEISINSDKTKNVIISAHNHLYAYLHDPDIILINSSLAVLDNEINSASAGLKKELLNYKKNYIDIVQSTRGYLFLIAVVMAGEAQEFNYVSTELKRGVIGQKSLVEANLKNIIELIYIVIIVSSIILILLALILSYFISLSINRPLNQLTHTFKLLAQNENVDNIPGINLQDEIGSMSRAAEVFRLNNEKTRKLVKELGDERIKLEKSNKELEQFAYITSHDLQEPLRTISSFVELFDKQYQPILDDKGRKYLAFINEASSRMHALIHGVLEYSRIGKVKDIGIVDLNIVVDEVLTDMDRMIRDKNSRINVEDLPGVHGNELEYRSLYANLISNALKFTKPDTASDITIGCLQKDDKNIYFVKDNGVGIEDGNRDKVFMMFQRIHDRKDYPGTGIGLAHCKKIIESHRGKIWFESQPGRGCTFFFTTRE